MWRKRSCSGCLWRAEGKQLCRSLSPCSLPASYLPLALHVDVGLVIIPKGRTNKVHGWDRGGAVEDCELPYLCSSSNFNMGAGKVVRTCTRAMHAARQPP